MHRVVFLSLFAVCLLVGNASAAVSGATVWVEDIHTRIRPSTTAPSTRSTSVSLSAARREYESFQIVVRSTGSTVTIQDFVISDLVRTSTTKIEAKNINVFREMFVTATQGSSNPLKLGKGKYADPLIPLFDDYNGKRASSAPYRCVPYDATSSAPVVPFFVDIFVPPSTVSGTYKGTITLKTNKGSQIINITLKVWAFTLPTAPTQASAMGMWGNDLIPDIGTQPYTATFMLMLRHRLQLTKRLPTNDIPLLKSMGQTVASINFNSGANVETCRASTPIPSDSNIHDWIDPFKNNKMPLIVGQPFDEVDRCTAVYKDIVAWGKTYHKYGIKQILTASKLTPELYEGVDIFALTFEAWKKQASQISKMDKKRIWSYTALSLWDDNSPTWSLDQPAMAYRMRPIINFVVGATGLLYWNVAYWDTKQPMTNVEAWGRPDSPGDGILMYPGTSVGTIAPAPSYRLKLLREGMEDADYFAMLSKVNSSAARTLSRKLAKSWESWTTKPSTMISVRKSAGSMLHNAASSVQHAAADTTENSAATSSSSSSSNDWVVPVVVAVALIVVLALVAVLFVVLIYRRMGNDKSYASMQQAE